MSDAATRPTPEGQDIYGLTKLAVILSFIGFLIPFVPAIGAFIVGQMAKSRLRNRGGDRMNEGLATIAQATAAFTLVLYGGFLWYALWKWGGWNGAR